MPGMQTTTTAATVSRLTTDQSIGYADCTFVSNTESQRYIFALNAKDAGDALAANNFFQTPIQTEWTWRTNPYFVWVASSVTAGSVTFKWD